MRDPIVEEVYEARAQIMEECGGDLNRLMDLIRAREAEHPELLVTLEEVRRRKSKKDPASKRKTKRRLSAKK